MIKRNITSNPQPEFKLFHAITLLAIQDIFKWKSELENGTWERKSASHVNYKESKQYFCKDGGYDEWLNILGVHDSPFFEKCRQQAWGFIKEVEKIMWNKIK